LSAPGICAAISGEKHPGLFDQPTAQMAADPAADPGLARPGPPLATTGRAGIKRVRRFVLQRVEHGQDAVLQALEPCLGAIAPGEDLWAERRGSRVCHAASASPASLDAEVRTGHKAASPAAFADCPVEKGPNAF
jgi:hypothetical protein